MSTPDDNTLSVRDLSASYGSLLVCRDISIDVKPGEVVALIGPNGAGKTSFIGALTGEVSAKGQVTLGATKLDGRPIHERTRLGVATVPDNRGLFAPLTVAENLRLGSMFVARTRRDEVVERAMSYFAFLKERGATLAGSLSGGQQQMLAIAKCLASDPRVLLLDEPSQGLAPIMLDEIVKVIGELKARRLPVLLVEQNYGLVERTADRFAVMVGGRIVMTGGRSELADRDKIGRLFLARRKAAVH